MFFILYQIANNYSTPRKEFLTMRSRLLLDERPLIILPNLATAIGLNEAIVLQQFHYWLNNKIHEPEKYEETYKDGYMWVYNSIEKWKEQFPFWHKNTIIRTINSLIDQGLIIKADKNYNKSKYDRTNWYTIDYLKFEELQERICVVPDYYKNLKR